VARAFDQAKRRPAGVECAGARAEAGYGRAGRRGGMGWRWPVAAKVLLRGVGLTMAAAYKVRDSGHIQILTLLIYLIWSKPAGFNSIVNFPK
jgi:hypothetical protein